MSNIPKLYIVATPIGNLKDISQRALSTLSEVNYILSEDTRVTKKLLSHFNIDVPLISYHTYNEAFRTEEALALLDKNYDLALVSDAGTPLISDPGFILISKAIEKGYKIISIPGPSAVISALVGSGIASDKFFFYGFLPSRQNKRRQEIKALESFIHTIIFYEAPHRINACLNDLYEILGNRKVVIARELTKLYEEYIRGTLQDVKDLTYKGELVIVLSGGEKDSAGLERNKMSIKDHYQYFIDLDYDEKEAMKLVAKERNISKSEVYKEILKLKKNH